MIQKINGLKTQTTNHAKLSLNKQNQIQSVSLTSEPDTFEKTTTPNFTGKEKQLGKLSKELVGELERANGRVGEYMKQYLPENKALEIVGTVFTAGLLHLQAYTRAKMDVSDDKQKIYENFTSNGSRESQGIAKTIDNTNKNAETIKTNLTKELEIFGEIERIQLEEIKPQLLDPLSYKTELPNSVMIVSKNPNVSEELIEWTKHFADAKIVTIDKNATILDYMEQAEAHYQKTGEHTLLHIKNFDDLINPTKDDNLIGNMKSLLGDCATEFHTTVLFSATNPEELDDIATADHRVNIIEANVEKSVGEMWEEIARRQVESGETMTDYEKVRNAVYLTGYYKDGINIAPNASPAEIQKVWNQIDSKLLDEIKTTFKPDKNLSEVVPAYVYVQNEDGSVEKFPAYNHKVGARLYFYNGQNAGGPISMLSFDKAPNAMQEFATCQKYWKDLSSYYAERQDYWIKNEIIRTYGDESSIYDNYFFNSLVSNYKKTGNKVLDEYFTNIDVSPFSPRSHAEYTYATNHKQFAPDYKVIQKVYIGNNEDKHSNGVFRGDWVEYRLPNTIISPPNFTPSIDTVLGDKIRLLAKIRGFEYDNQFPSAERLDEMNRLKRSVVFSEKELSPREIEQKFAFARLKDDKNCLMNSLQTLKDLLLYWDLDYQHKVDKNSSKEDIEAAVDSIKNSIIEKTKSDMRAIDYRKNISPGSPRAECSSVTGLPALMVIADGILAKEDNVKVKTISIQARHGAGGQSLHISPYAMHSFAYNLPHYEEIITSVEALEHLPSGMISTSVSDYIGKV